MDLVNPYRRAAAAQAPRGAAESPGLNTPTHSLAGFHLLPGHLWSSQPVIKNPFGTDTSVCLPSTIAHVNSYYV